MGRMSTISQHHFRYDYTAPHALVGHVVAERYLIQRLAKRGGVGSVFEALDTRENRPVAVKVMSISALTRRTGQHIADIVEQFETSAAHSRRLESEYTVPIADFGRTASFLFIVAELLPGTNLKDLLSREGRLDPLRAMRFAMHVAASLEESHNLGWYHGDLRPSNIFIARDAQGGEVAKVLDHGTARMVAAPLPIQLTASGRAAGIPDYMSPEQCRGGEFDRRTDFYSLGIVLYEMLSGSVPYRGRSQLWVMQQHINSTPPFIGEVYPRLARVNTLVAAIDSCLAKAPEMRPASARKLVTLLDHAVAEYLQTRG